MNASDNPRNKQVEEIIVLLLRSGVIVAACVAFAGGMFYLARYSSLPENYHVFRGEPEALTHVGGIFRSALGLDPRGIIQLGLLILIGTPVARVAFTVFAFVWERDWVYVVITLVVLALLFYSLGAWHL